MDGDFFALQGKKPPEYLLYYKVFFQALRAAYGGCA